MGSEQYRIGTAAVTNASSIVIGASTDWLNEVSLPAVFKLDLDGQATYSISSITSATRLFLAANYNASTNSGMNYMIMRSFTTNRGYWRPLQGDGDFAEILSQETIDDIDTDIGNIYSGTATLDKITLELGSTISNKENADVDTGTETVDSFSDTAGEAAMWFYRVKKSTNMRAGTIFASWEASGDTIESSEGPGTLDVGDTSDLAFDVDISSNLVRLRATAASDDWDIRVIRFLI